LIEAEKKDIGNIKWSDYRDFFSHSYGTCGIVTLLILCVICAVGQLLPSIWLTEWLSQDLEQQQESKYPIVFTIMVIFFILITMGRSLVIFKIVLEGATNLHNTMTQSVLRANILFFDSNPIGRIVTRFSKDLIVFDLVVPVLLIISLQGFFRTATVVITISVLNYWMIPIIIVLAFLLYYTMKQGSQVMIEAQRRDSESRTPIHGTFAMVINGLVSLRAMNKIDYFRGDFLSNLNFSTNATYSYVIANRWIGIRLDLLCSLFMIAITCFVIMLKGSVDTAYLLMSLQVSSDVIFLFSISFRTFAELENNMTSSQRMIGYTKLEPEDELEKPGDKDLEDRRMWPSEGKIEFEEATMRYRREMEPSIHNLSFKVQAGMIIGIVGRTGSGKSSILQTLFRLVELQTGRIIVDGVDIRTTGLHILRKSIAFIP